MANINSLTSNSYGNTSTNLYGSRNVLTGLASGMDTEAMIQNSISGYMMKIASLQRSQTKITWKQDAYRNLIDQMNSIIQKYTSYTSKTNLASNAFFTSARKTEALGAFASAVSATGSSKSDIQINSVRQLATAARYTVDASDLDFDAVSEALGKEIDWSERRDVGQINGTMTLKYGNQTVELNFDEKDANIKSAEDLKAAIEKKLSEINIRNKDGDNVKASSLIKVEVSSDGKNFTFAPNSARSDYDGSSVYINSISGNVGDMLGAKRPDSTAIEDKVKNKGFSVSDFSKLSKNQDMREYLSGKTVEVTLDGVTKTVKIGDLTKVKLKDGTQTTIDGNNAEIEKLNGKIKTINDTIAEHDKTIADIDKQIMSLDDEIAAAKERGDDTADLDARREDLVSSRDDAVALRDLSVAERDTLNGQVKNIEKANGKAMADEMTDWLSKDLEASIEKAFGKGKVTVQAENGRLKFDVAPNSGSTLMVKSSAGAALGIDGGVSNYFNTSNTLGNLLGVDWLNESGSRIKAEFGSTTGTGDDAKHYDKEGNRIEQGEDGEWYRTDENGKFLYSMVINGKNVGQFTEDTALENVLSAINGDAEAGVKVTYSNLTGQFVFTANETGEASKISFDSPLAKVLFQSDKEGKPVGGKLEEGKDAVVDVTVNGKKLTLKRSSNVIDMDGMTVTLRDTFNVKVDEDGNPLVGEDGNPVAAEGEAITFKTSSDSDAVVDVIKSFVEDVNKLMKDLYESYSTVPLRKSSSSKSSDGYEPLTEEDKSSMSESAIAAYEEKAKTGILFGDSDLSQLYSNLLSVIQMSGADRMDMESIGLTTTFSDGITQIAIDEDKLRAALDGDPDKVRNVFAKTVEGGAKTNGLMEKLKTTMNNYASISLASPGILVSKAGTKLSSLSLMNNHLQQQYDNIEKQIESWQSKMSNKVDYYTRQFTQLEKLMSMMNNQSSMLAGLMGGY